MPPERRARKARVRPWATLKATAQVKMLWRAPPERVGGGGGRVVWRGGLSGGAQHTASVVRP